MGNNDFPVLLGGALEADMTRIPYCKGAMADIRIYDRVLSDCDIAQLAFPAPRTPGDCNGDGIVDGNDIQCLVSKLLSP